MEEKNKTVFSKSTELNTGSKKVCVISRETTGVVEVAQMNSLSFIVLTNFISQAAVSRSGGHTE